LKIEDLVIIGAGIQERSLRKELGVESYESGARSQESRLSIQESGFRI
jgi:hypothetical protein